MNTCTNCGGKTTGKYKLCQNCRQKFRENLSRFRAKYIAQGLCPVCKQPTDSGGNCQACNKKLNVQQKARRDKRRNNGLCVICQKPTEKGYSRCRECRQNLSRREHDRYQDNRNKGLCGRCASPVELPGDALCLACRLKSQKWLEAKHQRKLAGNINASCASNKIDNTVSKNSN